MRRHDYHDRTVVKFGANTTAGTLTKDELKELSREMEEHNAKPNCRVDVHIETSHHTLDGVVEKWGLNHPTFLFDDGRRAFITPADDAEDIRLLLKDSYHGGRSTGLKYPVEEVTVEIYWYQTPDCPVCDEPLTMGMVEWDVHDSDGFMCGWLCENEIPARVEEGIY